LTAKKRESLGAGLFNCTFMAEVDFLQSFIISIFEFLCRVSILVKMRMLIFSFGVDFPPLLVNMHVAVMAHHPASALRTPVGGLATEFFDLLWVIRFLIN
jgi:hypothetical protein